MSMFTLAISCLITSNLPWFMDLTFQVPLHYCSLQQQTFTTRHNHKCVFFLLWLRLFVPSGAIFCSSLAAYWIPTDLGSSSFSVILLCLFILLHGFARQEYQSCLTFPFSVDHVLSELSTMNSPSWVALHSMVHSFIELDKAVIQVISLVIFFVIVVSILSALWLMRIRGCESFVMGGTGCGENWVLLLWSRPGSDNF